MKKIFTLGLALAASSIMMAEICVLDSTTTFNLDSTINSTAKYVEKPEMGYSGVFSTINNGGGEMVPLMHEEHYRDAMGKDTMYVVYYEALEYGYTTYTENADGPLSIERWYQDDSLYTLKMLHFHDQNLQDTLLVCYNATDTLNMSYFHTMVNDEKGNQVLFEAHTSDGAGGFYVSQRTETKYNANGQVDSIIMRTEYGSVMYYLTEYLYDEDGKIAQTRAYMRDESDTVWGQYDFTEYIYVCTEDTTVEDDGIYCGHNWGGMGDITYEEMSMDQDLDMYAYSGPWGAGSVMIAGNNQGQRATEYTINSLEFLNAAMHAVDMPEVGEEVVFLYEPYIKCVVILVGGATEIEDVKNDTNLRKVIMDNKVVIVRDGKYFDLRGVELR